MREPYGLIEDYMSFIWTERYFTPGDFELVFPASEDNVKMLQLGGLQIGAMIGRHSDERGTEKAIGIIEYMERSVDEDGRRRIILRGRLAGAYLYRRVIASQTIFTAQKTLKEIFTALLNDNVISPDNDDRRLWTLYVADGGADGPTLSNLQWTGQNLGQTISALCEGLGVGWKMERVQNGGFGDLEFSLYEGIDRSVSQSENSWAVFSDEDGSLLSLSYSESIENKINSVRVAGEGEGSERMMIWENNSEEESPTAYNRFETWVDARDIRSNNGEVTEIEYREMLENRAKESFTDSEKVLEANAIFTNLRYKTDVDLGDICTIKSNTLGIEVDARLVEVIESVDEEGRYSAVPTFAI